MVKRKLIYWPEITDANLRRQMKLEKVDLDEEALDDLNGIEPWEEAFLRGTKQANNGIAE
ncbi:hypothetical protein KY314_03315 [Candidatus Woesearchaeota archaeon]|nr:hypothetical protein [Candidatus Woesearchaeota archaeon]